MTHYFKLTQEAFKNVKDKDKRIIKLKRMPKEGDRLLFESAENQEQKELLVTSVDAERAGIMKNYYLVEMEKIEAEGVKNEASTTS